MPELPVVESQPVTERAIQHVQRFGGKFSHEERLPLQVSISRKSWLGRTISVTTSEDVWYEDAITLIRVESGLTYDLASIPKPLWWIVNPIDLALESLFHDLLYRSQIVKRSHADYLLRSMMEDRGVPWAIRWMVYLGVRIGGWKAWNYWAAKNREAAEAASAGLPAEMLDTPSSLAPDRVE